MFDFNVNRIKNSGALKGSKTLNDLQKETTTYNPNAFYIGVVEDTNDPFKLGRVRVRIPAIHGVKSQQAYYIDTNDLPWAKPAVFNSAGNDLGQFLVPVKGTRVVVSFEFNDMDKPLYFGGIPTIYRNTKEYNDNPNVYYGSNIDVDSDDRITDLEDKSAQSVIFKSFKGSTIIVDDKDGKESIKIIDAAGQQIVMENDSTVSLNRRGNTTNPPDTASISIISNGTVNIKCKHLNIEADSTNIGDYV